MKVEVQKLPKSQFKLKITIPVEEVKKTYDEVIEELVKETELPGFRKGFAPKEMIIEKTDVSKLYGEVINELLQKFYPQALKEKNIMPLSNPKVEIKGFDMDKDFDFDATVATKPEVTIKDFKSALKKTYEEKTKKLETENAEKTAKGEEIKETHAHLAAGDVIEALLANSETEVPDILVDEESDRMKSRLIDQAQSIGLSLEQYLKAQNKTSEQLKKDYSAIAEKSLKAEFVLAELVVKEAIEVSDKEVEDAVLATGDPKALDRLKNPSEKWYIKSILQKNTLINKLVEEVQGVHNHE